ncbi:CGL53B [Auxenochlorella protothecoides x Auxenochlorella symbiontica]
MSDFVKLTSDGVGLEFQGKPFKIVGANCHLIQQHGADSNGSGRGRMANVIKAAADKGINTLRIWAHNELTWNSIQNGTKEVLTNPDGSAWFEPIIDPNGIDGLDWAVAEAARNGVKLIMSLTNHWKEFGGIPQYARWASKKSDLSEWELQNIFFSNGKAQSMFKAYIQYLLNRPNPKRDGVRYKDDPTILAWSIANEPRGRVDPSGRTLNNWIADTSKFVKSQDSNHLVTVDVEGFFLTDQDGVKASYLNPGQLQDGCDFIKNVDHETIDFACMHMYQDLWPEESIQHDKKKREEWIKTWLNVHLKACQGKLSKNKPLILSEFSERKGKDESFSDRQDFLKKVYGWLQDNMGPRGIVIGSVVWMISDETFIAEGHDDEERRCIIIDGDGKDGLQQVIDHADAVYRQYPSCNPRHQAN